MVQAVVQDSRLRRLLPPMWAFALVVVPLMFVVGWRPAREEGLWWFLRLANYIVPFGAPPYPYESGSPGGLLEETWAEQAAGLLWYIRAYLWFVLASPLLLRAFRKVPWATLLFPVALTAVLGTGLVEIPGETGEALSDFAIYGACWVLGFAHNDGAFRKVPPYLTVSLATFTMAFALWRASGHLTDEGWNLDPDAGPGLAPARPDDHADRLGRGHGGETPATAVAERGEGGPGAPGPGARGPELMSGLVSVPGVQGSEPVSWGR